MSSPLSSYRPVWLFTLFDLPVVTRENRRNYSRFRNRLLADGFTQLQYSVYARHCPSEEAAQAHRAFIASVLPPLGHVRLVHVTDRQFAQMEIFAGKNRESPEDPPPQLLLF